jgi:hypothetical protein
MYYKKFERIFQKKDLVNALYLSLKIHCTSKEPISLNIKFEKKQRLISYIVYRFYADSEIQKVPFH